MTGFATQIRHIHPFLPQEEDKANELVLLRLSYMERVPCPAPPLYGRELQVPPLVKFHSPAQAVQTPGILIGRGMR